MQCLQALPTRREPFSFPFQDFHLPHVELDSPSVLSVLGECPIEGWDVGVAQGVRTS